MTLDIQKVFDAVWHDALIHKAQVEASELYFVFDNDKIEFVTQMMIPCAVSYYLKTKNIYPEYLQNTVQESSEMVI